MYIFTLFKGFPESLFTIRLPQSGENASLPDATFLKKPPRSVTESPFLTPSAGGARKVVNQGGSGTAPALVQARCKRRWVMHVEDSDMIISRGATGDDNRYRP